MQPETVNNLRGQGHETADLKKIIDVYKNWHQVFMPKLEYGYFVEKTRKHNQKQEVSAYIQQLRNHYKGTEIIEDFKYIFGDGNEDVNAEQPPVETQH